MFTSHAVRAVTAALLALLFGAASASAATDHVVITGGAVVAPGQTAGDVVVVDGPVRIGGGAAGVGCGRTAVRGGGGGGGPPPPPPPPGRPRRPLPRRPHRRVGPCLP